MKEILLFSGGPDSLIAWFYLGKPECLRFHCGHVYDFAEYEGIKHLVNVIPHLEIRHEGIFDFAQMEEADAFIPGRNGFFVLGAFALGYDKVYLVCQKDEMSIPDRSPDFFRAIENFAPYLFGKNRQYSVETPFASRDKTDMVKWYLEQDLPEAWLKHAISCYNAQIGDPGCGCCAACFRRWVAYANNGITEEWQTAPWISPIAEDYQRRMGEYSKDRQKRMVVAFKSVGIEVKYNEA